MLGNGTIRFITTTIETHQCTRTVGMVIVSCDSHDNMKVVLDELERIRQVVYG